MKKFARFAALVALAMVVGLGAPSRVSASDTITCDAPPLIAANPTLNAQLGGSLSAGGEWLAAGALQDNAKAGSVALYKNPGAKTDPHPDQQITAGDSLPGDQFGASVSISFSNNVYWLAVGAPGRAQNSGAVYLFKFDGTSWVQTAPTLSAADAAQGAQFGFSVSLVGSRLVVGAPGDSDRGSLAGSAYVFELQGSWNQTKELHADDDGRPFDEFGFAVATAGDQVVVGAPFADFLHGLFKNFGAAYVFGNDNAASDGWKFKVKLTADGGFRGDNIQFGASVAIGAKDTMGMAQLVVGVPGDDLQNRTDSGSAYVFKGSGVYWSPKLLTPEDPGTGKQFGSSVLIDGDGSVVIGSRFDGEDGLKAGAAYLFQNNPSWTEINKYIRPAPGAAFGQSVVRLNGQVFMGGYLDDVGLVVDAGSVAVCPGGNPCPSPPSAPSISRKDHQATVQQGQTVTYRIDVVGASPGAKVSDMFPQGLEEVGWCSGADCTEFDPPPFSVTLPVGGAATYLVRGRVLADTGTLTVKACVGIGVCSPACTPIIDTIQSAPTPMPELSCVKTGPVMATGRDIVTYDIAVSNIGNAAARNVTLSDPTPAGLSLVSVSGPCTQFPCDLGTLQPGQTLPPVTAKFQVAACPAPSSVTNLATVVGSNAPEATCSRTTVVPPVAEVGVSVSAPAQVAGGDSFNVSVVVTNDGPSTALGVTVDLSIANAGVVESFPPGCTQVGNQPGHFTCLLGDIPCASKPLIFSVRAPSCVTCAAGTPIVVTADAMSQTFDPTLPNHAMASIAVVCTPMADLAITKEDSPDPVAAGNELQYKITVTNMGCLDVLGATVSDVFPARLTNVRWCREMGGLCNPSQQGDLNDTLSLAVGDSAVYLVKGTVVPICGGTLVNTATVSLPTGVVDIDPSNNSATATTKISAPPGVSIQCSGVSGAFEGDYVTFTYVLSNGGPNAQGDNPGAEFTDTLPTGLSLITATASSGTVTTAANTVSWNGSIPVCGTVTISVQAKVDPATAGMTLCNQGNVAFDANGDGVNESNASALCCVTIIPVCTLPFCMDIPTLEPAGLAALIILLACVGLLRLRRRSL